MQESTSLTSELYNYYSYCLRHSSTPALFANLIFLFGCSSVHAESSSLTMD